MIHPEHRVQVGRTGRAGKDGAVTSLVSDESRDLADAIRCSPEYCSTKSAHVVVQKSPLLLIAGRRTVACQAFKNYAMN